MAPMPPSELRMEDASIGINTILELGAEPIEVSASVYFWATK